MQVAFKLFLFMISICYPIAYYYSKGSKYAIVLAIVMCAIWLIKAYLDATTHKKISLFIAFFFGISVIFQKDFLLYWYPAILSLVLLIIFASSLLAKQSFIEKIARIKHPDLDAKAVKYTRQVTYTWCGFFIFNAGFISYCVLSDHLKLWTVYTGFISYILMILLFVGEWLYRTFIIRPTA